MEAYDIASLGSMYYCCLLRVGDTRLRTIALSSPAFVQVALINKAPDNSTRRIELSLVDFSRFCNVQLESKSTPLPKGNRCQQPLEWLATRDPASC